MSKTPRDRSVAVTAVRQAVDRLQSASEQSVFCEAIDGIRRLLPASTASDGEQSASKINTATARSTVVSNWRGLSSSVPTAVATARCLRFTNSLKPAVFNSFSYQWFTADPEPGVIVIDLRDTWTAGPIIASVDRTLRELTAGVPTSIITGGVSRAVAFGRHRPIKTASLLILMAVCGSLLAGAVIGALSLPAVVVLLALAVVAVPGLRSTQSLAELQETWIVRLLVAAFEPPEPAATAHTETGRAREVGQDDSEPTATRDGTERNPTDQ